VTKAGAFEVRSYTLIHHASTTIPGLNSEILPDKPRDRAATSIRNAITAVAAHEVTIQRAMTDIGAC
jgi:hypothetical protein